MRTLLFILLMLPFVSNAQINRSANELATERIGEYISTKLFKTQLYSPVFYGELKPIVNRESRINWVITHRFEITDSSSTNNNKQDLRKLYKFSFYLDEKMRVIRAESSYPE